MRTFVLFQIVVLFLMFGCKKTERETKYFPDELKPYSLFGMGSYWIYKNDLTGNEDSTYLFSPPSLSFYYYGETGPKEERLDCQFGGSFLTSVSGVPDDEGPGYQLGHSVKRVSGSMSIVSGSIYKGYYRQSKFSSYIFKVISTNDTLYVNSSMYVNVLVTQYIQFPFPGHDSAKFTYFFDKSHGLIKFVKNTNGLDSSWSLVRSHVLR